jgi:DNA-directed RNA polymerase subunit M/transcription elongation factor TFIIS
MPPKSTKSKIVTQAPEQLPVQRNTELASEMADAPKPKTARKSKTAAPAAAPELPTSNVSSTPAAVIAEPAAAAAPALDLAADVPEAKSSAIRFCPTCRYYLFLQASTNTLQRLCRNCGYTETDEKGGLVMEQSSETSEGYKILVNEFTRYDVRLPHIVKTLRCPEPVCKSNQGAAESDILYIKYDPANLKYLYICTSCGFQWTSRR